MPPLRATEYLVISFFVVLSSIDDHCLVIHSFTHSFVKGGKNYNILMLSTFLC